MERQRAMKRVENTEVALLVMKRSDLILLFFDVRGTYRADIETSGSRIYARYTFGNRPNIEVKLEQNKDKITGTFSGDRSGELEGIIDEDVIKFKWFLIDSPGGSKTGKGEWKVSNEGQILIGTWARTGIGSTKGKWTLTRIE